MITLLVIVYVLVGFGVMGFTFNHNSNNIENWSVRFVVSIIIGVIWLPVMILLYFMEIADR